MASVEREWSDDDGIDAGGMSAAAELSLPTEPTDVHAILDLRAAEPVVELRPARDVVLDLRDAVRMRDAVGDGIEGWPAAVKRAVDLVGSAIGLILLAPVFGALALLVRLTSPGRAFFVQERIGRDGAPFRMIKFRSMYEDAPQRRHDLAHRNQQSGPAFKIDDDPRITPLGRVLRRLSLDELPQLVNVLRGEMSLVGPRPPLPEEYAQWSERERLRLTTRPGLTCIWQVSGRSDLDYETWVEMDLRYLRTWSLWLDLRLLVRTIPAVLFSRGAY